MEPISEKELKEYRYLFPVSKKIIYLNHAAVAPISLRVADAVMKYNQEALHEGYTAGPRWVKHFEDIRKSCAKLINAQSEEIAFVKNTSHGLSLIARGLDFQSGDEIIISDVEFPANVYPWMALEDDGVVLKKIPSLNGTLDLDRLSDLITEKTKLISLSSVQFGTGFKLPIKKIGKFCREKGIYFCVDAIQSLGAFPIDVVAEHVDFLASDGHKWMLGHEGIGIFYVRKELITGLEPALVGWNSVKGALNFDNVHYLLRDTASRFEEGSHNGLSLFGLGAAVDLLLEVGVDRIAQRILMLTDLLIKGLQDLGLTLHNSLDPEYRSGIVLFTISDSLESRGLEELENHLFSKNIYTTIRRGGLRISPHFYNSEQEIETVLKEIKNYLDHG